MAITMLSRRLILLIVLVVYVSGLSNIFANAVQQNENQAATAIVAVDTFFVSPQGSNTSGDGSKSKPWRSLSFALAQLKSDSAKPKVLKLANGAYSAANTGESFPLHLKSWISVVGSDSMATIIDASKAAQVFTGENVAHILISRMTLRNGFANADTGKASQGGGLWLRNCRQLEVRGCVIRDNEAKTLGGGVFFTGGSEIRLESNRLENNRAYDGAGIYCTQIKYAQILSNILQYNLAKNSAGGVYIDSATPVLQRNRIRWNNASTGLEKNPGGILVRASAAIIGGTLGAGNDIHDNIGGSYGSQLFVMSNQSPVNVRYNYWGAEPDNRLVTPAILVDFSNYRNLAINIPLGTTNFFISPNGSDQNNGSKSAPWRSIRYALSQIFASSIDTLTVNLAPGTYSTVTTGERFPVYFKSYITLIGATTSGPAVSSPSGGMGLPTIIDGIGVAGHELFRLEEVRNVRIANLMIRNVKTNTNRGVIWARGCEEVTIDHCIFEDNQAQRGAAITFSKAKNSQIRDNLFRRNRSNTGGALALLQDGSTVSNNVFTENLATIGGGAVHCDSTSDTRLQHNDFQENSAGAGGAVYITRSNPRLSNNHFIANHATISGGGAIALDGASLPLIGARDAQANDIYLNTAVRGGSQVYRLDPGLKADARYNFWGQVPDSTLVYPLAQFATENYRQVSERLPSNTREIYVSPKGDDAASGISLDEPLRTISQALRYVMGTETSPITLHLLSGRFAVSTSGETFPIVLKNHIILRGTSRNATTIDAESRSRVFEGRGLSGSVIANLNIVGGVAPDYGGAIYLTSGTGASTSNLISATIENCILQNNTAAQGGAVAAIRHRKTVLRGCILANNTARQNGGAVLAIGDSVEISNSEFYSNRAEGSGGAVSVDTTAVLTLMNNRIHDNTASQGGGILVKNGVARIWHNVIIDNWAQNGAGGGIFLSANGKAIIGGSSENGNDLYGNRALNPGQALGSAQRSDKIEARFNFWGGKPDAAMVGNTAIFDITKYRYVTISAPENAREFYLSPKGNDTNSGVSPASPWQTVTAAMRRFFTEPGDSVRLQLLNGTYSASTTGEQLPLHLPSRVSLIGQHADSVIWDGGGKTRLLEINNASSINVHALTLVNGNRAAAHWGMSPQAEVLGGAVFVHNSSHIRFEQVKFLRHVTTRYGGALAADSSQAVILRDCRLLENRGYGAGVYMRRTSGEIRGCEFRLNRSPGHGSAIYLDNAAPLIASNFIIGNVSESSEIGGAIFCAGNATPIIGGAPGQGNDIYNNTGGRLGKALARDGNTPMIDATYNYLGAVKPGEPEVYPLNGFDIRYSRQVPVTANGLPVVTQIKPPTNPPVRAGLNDTLQFQISAYDPDNDPLTLTWTVDSSPTPVAFGTSYTLFSFSVGLGEHQIRVVVSDQRDTVMVHWQVMVQTTRVASPNEKLPATFALQQNFPNPLRSAAAMTVIPYQIPRENEVVLEIYDLLGRRVRLLEQLQKPAGFYTADWDGRDQHGRSVESGIYFVRLQAGQFTAMRKILVTK